MNNKKKRIAIVAISLIIIAIIVIITLNIFTKRDLTYMQYKEFYEELEKENIEKVLIQNDKVEFTKKDDRTTYYTENPDYEKFKENLLLKQVEVKIDSTEESIGFILDLFFYIFFFTIIIFAIIKLATINKNTFKVIKHTKIKFSDIAGMDELKQEMITIVDILKNPEEYSKKGIRQTKGIILEGKPGNGKTLFAKALAGEANVNFIATKGTDFQSGMMSMGARKIKMLFKKARKHTPCIIFIDEFDGIGERRNYAGSGVDKENNRIITAMLNEMDGFETKDGILVIAATNSFLSLDAALIRPGRFDLKYNIPNPDLETRKKLIELYTKNKKLSDEINKEKLAESFDNLSCSAIETILNEASTNAILQKNDTITVNDIIIAGKKTNCNINVKKIRSD